METKTGLWSREFCWPGRVPDLFSRDIIPHGISMAFFGGSIDREKVVRNPSFVSGHQNSIGKLPFATYVSYALNRNNLRRPARDRDDSGFCFVPLAVGRCHDTIDDLLTVRRPRKTSERYIVLGSKQFGQISASQRLDVKAVLKAASSITD